MEQPGDDTKREEVPAAHDRTVGQVHVFQRQGGHLGNFEGIELIFGQRTILQGVDRILGLLEVRLGKLGFIENEDAVLG